MGAEWLHARHPPVTSSAWWDRRRGQDDVATSRGGTPDPEFGSITVLDEAPASSAEQLGRIGFVAQDTPVYESLSIATHLRWGRR